MMFYRKKRGQKVLTSLLCFVLFVGNVNFSYIQVRADESMSVQEMKVTDEIDKKKDEELDSDVYHDNPEVILSEEQANVEENRKVGEEESCVEKNKEIEEKESFEDGKQGIQEESCVSNEKESRDILKISVSESDIASGSYENITWIIDAYGKLMVEGTGEISYNAGARRAPWHSYVNDIKVAIVNVENISDASCMFYDCENLTSVDLSNFDTTEVTNISCMFYNCKNLKNANFGNFNVHSAVGLTNMSNLFCNCTNLESVNLSGLNISSATNMSGMFYRCSSLTDIRFDKINTNQVTNMSSMFSGCHSLTNLDVSDFDTSQVTNMSGMFSSCDSLTNLDVSNFDTRQVTNMSDMFNGCSSLISLDLSKLNTANVTNMSNMFNGCDSLTILDVSSFDTRQVTNMSNMFRSCDSLTNLDVSSFNTSQVTNMSDMFYSCNNLTNLDLSSFNTNQVTNMSDMFWNCNNLISVDVSSFDTSQVMNMSSMFSSCNNLINLDVSNFNTSQVINMEHMFVNCRNVSDLNVSNFDTNKVTNMSGMFSGCSNLTNIDVSSFNTGQVTNMSNMFRSCDSLTNLDVSSFDTSNVTSMENMFGSCDSLTNLNVSNFDTSSVTNMVGMFSGCSSLTNLDLTNFNTSNVTNMSFMFSLCENLINVDISNFDTSNVTNMESMFYICRSLTSIDLSSFNTYNVTDMSDMFSMCRSLTRIDISNFDVSNVIRMIFIFSACDNLTVINTPLNLKLSVTLPAELEDIWILSDETEITELPQNLSYSVEIIKNKSSIGSGDNIASGSYKDITWVIDSNGKLTVEGSGEISDSKKYDRAPWHQYYRSIKSAEIYVKNISDTSYMFDNCIYMTSIDLKGFDTSSVTNMSGMFYDCNSLINLDLSNFDTSNVTNMYQMFHGCNNLIELDLSNFDVSNVTNMINMFYDCKSLIELNLSSFGINNVTDMDSMFGGCKSLTNLDLSNFNTSNVTNMYQMFYDCSSLIELDLSNFDTSNVISMDGMFRDCSSLIKLDLSNFNTSNLDGMSFMFYNCSSLTKLDLSSFDTCVTELMCTFDGCSSLIELDLSNFNTSYVETMECMFSGCSSLVKLDLSSFDTSNVMNMELMFSDCKNLFEINLSSLNTSCVGSMYSMFLNCSSLEKLNLSNFNTSQVVNMECMFSGCSSLKSLDLSNFDISEITETYHMFLDCNSLTMIKTPYNVKSVVYLPKLSGDIWYQPDGTEITELPKNISNSITITKNQKPTTAIPYITVTKTKTSYQCGDMINIDDVTVRYCDTNGTVTTVTDYTTNADKIDMSAPGKKILEITYNNLQATIELTVTEKEEDINPDDPESPEKKGLKVSLKYGENYTYTGKAIKPEVVVTYNGAIITEGVDYTIKYSNNINANTTVSSKDKMPKVIVTGKGNWNGSDSVNFVILPADIQNVIIGGTSKDENGEEILTVIEGSKKANTVLYYGDMKVNSKNYTVIEKGSNGYSSKDNGKTITIKANNNGNFTGTRTLKVNVINKSKLKKFTVFVDPKELLYDGTSQKNKIDFIVYDKVDNSIDLEEGKDYVVSWSGDTTNAGKVKFTIIGLGLYSGTNITKTCTIKPIKADESEMIISGIDESGYDFVSTGVTIDSLNVTYKETVLVKGRDYKVTFGNNKKAGIAKYTVSFLGNYKGSVAKKGTFLIHKAIFGENSKEELNVMIADKVYNGKPGTYKSTPYVILNGIALKASDYIVSYYTDADCTKPVSNANKIELWKDNDSTTIYVKIEAKDKSNYSGNVMTSYQVRNNSDFIDLSNAKIILDKKTVTYTGNACTNTLKVYCKKGTGWSRIYENIDFKITYANNINKGKAIAIITGMDGTNYIGAKTATFNIAAQKVNLK